MSDTEIESLKRQLLEANLIIETLRDAGIIHSTEYFNAQLIVKEQISKIYPFSEKESNIADCDDRLISLNRVIAAIEDYDPRSVKMSLTDYITVRCIDD